jgi:CubicO group peptidase (beta-lactamase class C family)
MSALLDRRNFLSLVAAGTAGSCIGQAQPTSKHIERNDHIVYHYEDPFDFGVMQGPEITDETFVGKNNDLPTCFFADQKRMRWALQHMSVLQRTQPIARGGEVWEFSYEPLDYSSVRVKTTNGQDISVDQWLKRTETDGFLVLYLSRDQGPLVATEQYFNGLKPDRLHHLWSMSKSFSAGLVAHAMEKELLKREDSVGDILPELKQSGLGTATIDQVLNMASSAKTYVGDPWSFDGMIDFALRRWMVACGLIEWNEMDPELLKLGCLGFLATVGKEANRETGFDYKDVDSRTAVAAAERVLGGPFHELFSDLIWSKIGAEHDAYVCCDQFGNALTPFGVSATLRDCARWGLMHLPEAPRSILPQKFIENLVHPHPSFASSRTRKLDTVPAITWKNGGYRDQYWIYPKGEGGGFLAGGWMGQQIHIYPSLNVVIVQLATLWPDNYAELVPDGPAFLKLAEFVAETYRKQGV